MSNLPIGVFIGILGLVGVLVPLLREHIGRREKALWTFVMFVLLILEIRVIYADRDRHDKEQREAQEQSEKNFSRIADGITLGIKQNQLHFDSTMARLKEQRGREAVSLQRLELLAKNNQILPDDELRANALGVADEMYTIDQERYQQYKYWVEYYPDAKNRARRLNQQAEIERLTAEETKKRNDTNEKMRAAWFESGLIDRAKLVRAQLEKRLPLNTKVHLNKDIIAAFDGKFAADDPHPLAAASDYLDQLGRQLPKK